MALTKDQKESVVVEISELLKDSKMTVFATYSGSSVKALQELRRTAKDSGTTLKVVKNRLFKQALESSPKLKGIDASVLTGQLIYGFNSEDEVAPAQNLAEFAKANPSMEFVGAITEDAQLISGEDVKALAALPSKQQLRAHLVATLMAPQRSFANVLAASLRGVLYALNARADVLGRSN